MWLILIVILLVLLLGGGGGYVAYDRYGPGYGGGVLVTVLLILLCLYLFGGLRFR